MIYRETSLPGAYVIDLDKRGDDRGFFARLFCMKEFGERGLETGFVQVNNSLSATRGTMRGMHYQLPPRSEVKLVRCIRGALYDVALDLREGSQTFGKWFAAELTEENRTMMYVPEGLAHGFMTLEPNTEVVYWVSSPYSPELERGIRWDDPMFGIEWPTSPVVISEKDASHPDFDPAFHLGAGKR